MNRAKYKAMFRSNAEAIEFEHNVLSSGGEFLPACARQVRDGGPPSAAYWAWLAGQLAQVRSDGQ